MTRFSELLQTKKNFVFIGETGSGKTEIALNTAALLQKAGACQVHLFDLDQTKAMFRARDAETAMTELGIAVHYMPQLLDTPVLVNGIIPHLVRKDSICILDVGGNENAARMVGCLSDYLNGENSAAIYVINPYRPWSGSWQEIEATMSSVLNACHLERIFYVANPTIGRETSAAEVSEGLSKLEAMIPSEKLSGIFVTEDTLPFTEQKTDMEMIPLRPWLESPWTI